MLKREYTQQSNSHLLINEGRKEGGLGGREGRKEGRKEGNVLFNDALNTKEIFYLTMHLKHFVYSYMASVIEYILFMVIRRQTYGKGPLR